MGKRGVQVRSAACAFWLLWAAAATAEEECLRSYKTSQGFTLRPGSLRLGAELLDARPVSGSAACRSHCCASRRCDLALVDEKGPGRALCLLVDCTVGRTPVCALDPSPGVEANLKGYGALDAATPPVDCTSPAKAGPCWDSISRWYYDVKEKKCQRFHYGGCMPNLNNYVNEEDCMRACTETAGPLNNLVPEASKGETSLKDCSRHCSDDEFRCDDGCCVPFTLMCDGSALCLNKSDLRYCSAIRSSYKLLTASGGKGEQNNDSCTAPSEVGPCRAAFSRWYFDPVTQSCHKFIYGGCKGNRNNYEDEQQCLTSCTGQKEVLTKPRALKLSDADDEASCFAPAVTGPCRAAFPRWYYNPASQTCQRFTYGGCKGNKNSYVSESTCLARCSGKTGNWEDGDGETHKQHQAAFHHRVYVVVMVGLLVVCILILLGGVIYFIIKLTRTDHVVSFHRNRSEEDKETLIHTA
ncbi:actinia tenebrosa protease inhibitors-like [Narcine bancroftii]|uniref:actinia tenebrosa protease inhibitors-like n=1 Tax=Narcine bancroftii TaxID=1343680 RepID=UPI0038311763